MLTCEVIAFALFVTALGTLAAIVGAGLRTRLEPGQSPGPEDMS